MTLQESEQDLVELVSPESGRMIVEFSREVAPAPDVEGTVTAIMFEAESTDGDVCEAIANYARVTGMTARYFLGREAMVVAFADKDNPHRVRMRGAAFRPALAGA